jgi:hypothetical protein
MYDRVGFHWGFQPAYSALPPLAGPRGRPVIRGAPAQSEKAPDPNRRGTVCGRAGSAKLCASQSAGARATTASVSKE